MLSDDALARQTSASSTLKRDESSTFIPISRVMRPRLRESQNQSKVNKAIQQLRIRLEFPDPDLESIKKHLYILQRWYLSMRPEKREVQANAFKAGGITLQWVWNHNLHLTNAFLNDHEMLDYLCVLLVAEKLDDFIVKWLSLPVDARIVGELGKGGLTWRGSLWRNLIAAELSLAVHSRDATQAIARLLSVYRLKQRFRDTEDFSPGSVARMSTFPAKEHLANSITSGAFPHTDPGAYENLAEFYRGGTLKTAMEWQYPTLCLWHPTHPDPMPLLQYLREHSGNIAAGFGGQSDRARHHKQRQLVRLSRLLHESKMIPDAAWVESLLPPVTQISTTQGMNYAREYNKLKPPASEKRVPSFTESRHVYQPMDRRA